MKISGRRRASRLGDLILRELSTMLVQEVQDPRLEFVTLSAIRMNVDMTVAEVFYTCGAGSDKEGAEAALRKAGGFMRSQLGRRIKVRVVPELRFMYDDFLENMVYAKPAADNSENS
ncbi:30S ribosome-binding factor RbfA [Salidesulfovibrio onnuriiensis]|uniref:30S ribosome-binding factor RbfA n=1 Tax=Salidesulfovibrio onnuriiensis TaxID=2583823 RepID=UPI0011CB3456|nr:30S ribosome-binding factor RbfA [Salidesulfovibrio onnuriiensis]